MIMIMIITIIILLHIMLSTLSLVILLDSATFFLFPYKVIFIFEFNAENHALKCVVFCALVSLTA